MIAENNTGLERCAVLFSRSVLIVSLECFIKKYQNNFLAYNEHKCNTIELLNKEHKVKNLSTDNIGSNKSLLKEIVKTYCKELCIDDTKFIKYIDEY